MAQDNKSISINQNVDEHENHNIELLKICADSFLQKGDFLNADKYYLEMTEKDPEALEAYLGLLLVDTKVKNIEELFTYFFVHDSDPVGKISTRLNDLYYKHHLASSNNNPSTYQRFVFNTYRKIQGLYEGYLNDRDNEYLEYINTYNETRSIDILTELMDKFDSLNGYKDSKRYITRCKEKIEKINQDKAKQELNERINNLLTLANDFLQGEDYNLADEYFSEVLQLDPENIDANLGILMIDTRTTNKEELYDYYRNLYIEDQTEILEACKKDINHINEMISKYSIPGYLDAETIKTYYEFDNTYVSVLNSRLEQKDKIIEELYLNPILAHIRNLDNVEYSRFASEILKPYEKKVSEAKKLDDESIGFISQLYYSFVKKADDKIIDKYNDLAQQLNIKKEVIQEKQVVEKVVEKVTEEAVKKEKKKAKKKIADKTVAVPGLDETYALLTNGQYDQAKENLELILEDNPDNADAYIGLLMINSKTNNIDDLFAYYKNLYNQESTETLQALDQNDKHINEMINKYEIKGVLDRKDIIEKYKFDASYPSRLSSCQKAKHALLNNIYNDDNFINLQRLNDEEILTELQKVIDIYEQRIEQAQKQDDAQINRIVQEYDAFIDKVDEEIISIYKANEDTAIDHKQRKAHLFKTLGISAAVILLLLGVIYLANRVLLKPSNNYKQAITLLESKKYEEAIAIFEQLGTYKDSQIKIEEAKYGIALDKYEKAEFFEALNILIKLDLQQAKDKYEEIRQYLFENIKVGSSIVFGQYEQDGNSENGREPIEWQVLAIDQDRALVISKKVIDTQKYDNTYNEQIDWQSSNVRFWLNGRFPDNAFNNEDPSKILETTLTNYYLDVEENREYEYETIDKLFLLSKEEVEEYFADEISRTALAVDSIKDLEMIVNEQGNCDWWLRSLGDEEYSALRIWGQDGSIANSVMIMEQGIRPAMWISLNR